METFRKNERTRELDKHWIDCPPDGAWYCYTCAHYTGQIALHPGHDTVRIHSDYWILHYPDSK